MNLDKPSVLFAFVAAGLFGSLMTIVTILILWYFQI